MVLCAIEVPAEVLAACTDCGCLTLFERTRPLAYECGGCGATVASSAMIRAPRRRKYRSPDRRERDRNARRREV